MNMKNKKLAICIVEAQGIMLYMEKFPTGNSYTFPQGSLVHMEIANYEVFHAFIATIATAVQLADHDVIIIFGNSLLFEKQLPQLPPEKLDEEVMAFRESAPFERVGARTYKNLQGTYVVSMNRDFFDTLRQSIERNGAHVLAILPMSLFIGMIGKKGMNQQALRSLSSRISEIVELSLVSGRVVPKTFQQQEEYFSKQYSGPLIAVFILFILGVIGGTGFILRSQFQAARSPVVTPPPQTSQTPTTPVLDPTASPEVISTPENLQIMVQYGSAGASVSAKIRTELQAQGFPEPSEKKVTSVTAERTLVLFRPSVSSQIREQVRLTLEKAGISSALQESAEIETDVWITVGR